MSTKQLVVGAAGIYFAYITSGIIYEKLYSHQYPSRSNPTQTHRFEYPGLIVWVGSLLCAIFGFIRAKMTKQSQNPIPMKEQIFLGALYTVNISSANYALIYLSYLTQTLGRNCRYLFVVIVGALFSRVKKGGDLKLNPQKIIVAGVITFGVVMFSLMKTKTKEKQTNFNPDEEWKGYLLIIMSLLADALFCDSQAYSKQNFKPTANHLFTSANFLTFIFTLFISVFKGELLQQIEFCADHPRVILELVLAGGCQVLGQVSIYYVIANFKQHIFPLISTTRKVFTVLLSIFIYNHSMNIWQWLMILLVFGGLIYQVSEEVKHKKKQEEKKEKKD